MELYEVEQKMQLSLDAKIVLTKRRIKEYHDACDGNIYVSFSGGKDSTVLLHIMREMYPNTIGVFSNTGLEYPEIVEFVNKFDNIEIVKPEMSFKKVLDTYGYPVVSKFVSRQIHDLRNPTERNFNTRRLYDTGVKRDGSISKQSKLSAKWRYLIKEDFKISDKCCLIMKKKPLNAFERKSGLHGLNGVMASNSRGRMLAYMKTGCNSYGAHPQSKPLSIWTDDDIWAYINKNELEYCPIYDTGVQNTGCIFCMFGVHLEGNPNRFQLLKESHPQLYKYCMDTLGLDNILTILKVEH